MGRHLAIPLIMVALAGCTDKSELSTLDDNQLAARTRNPCRNVTCWDHATCQVVNRAATCVCEPGYVAEGLTCVDPVSSDASLCAPVPTASMTASATSAEPGYEPALALDGAIGTFWHTPWETTTWGPTQPLPQSITIELGGTSTVASLTYQPPAQSNPNGIITAFNVYLSTDGQSFAPVASGTWADDASVKNVSFTAQPATHVRLEATEGHAGFAAAGEISVSGCATPLPEPQPEPQPGPPPSSTWAPPGTHYHVNAGMSPGQIQAVIDGAGTGNTVVFDPGTYDFGAGTLRGRSGTTFYAPDVVEITNAGGAGTQGAFDFTDLSGFWLLGAAPGHGFSLSTFIELSNAADFHVGNMSWHDVPGDVGYHGSAVQMHNAVRFEIVNSDFVRGSGNYLLGWNIDNATFDGLHMHDYWQGIDLGFGSSHDRGRNITIRRMVSTGVERMPIETVGDGDTYSRDFLVEDSWFDDFGPEGGVAISIVHKGDVEGLVVRNNFIRRGPRTFNSIGVEWWSNSGGCWYNDIRDMAAGIIFYNGNYDAQYNNVTNAAWGTIVDYSGTVRGNIANNTSDDTRPIPPQPQRRVWP